MSENADLPLLDLQGASVHYGRAIALASITLTVRPGELVAVIGPAVRKISIYLVVEYGSPL